MARAPDTERLFIPGPAGRLQALLETPAETAGTEQVAIICHPHPQYQGTMQNKVVHTVARAMNALGLAVLRFNFRGVGESDGSYADGIGEMADLAAVAAYVRQRWSNPSIWLAGFSFGAVVSARAAAEIQPAQLVSIAPAVNVLGAADGGKKPSMPWLIVQGGADEVVPYAEVRDWVAANQPGPKLIVMPDAGHFFHGQLVNLRKLLVANLR